MSERWLPVVGFEGSYEVSDLGRVRGVDRICNDGSHRRSRVLKPRIANGYARVSLAWDGKVRTCQVHQLVLQAFVGPRPEGLVTRHLDGDRSNNALANLVWGTYTENGQDTIRHGRTLRGALNVNCKLTPEIVRHARKQVAGGRKIAAVARELGVPYHAVWGAVRGQSWNWVE